MANIVQGAIDSIAQNVQMFRNTIEQAVQRVAQLGKWGGNPDSHSDSLLRRVPRNGHDENGTGYMGSGFDGGIAVALGFTVIDGQEFGRLSASLHMNPTADDYLQVRQEIGKIARGDMRNDTAIWLLACIVCDEGNRGVTEEGFYRQVQKFNDLRDSMFSISDGRSTQIQGVLMNEVASMRAQYSVMDDGVPYADSNSGGVGAYIDGNKFSVFHSNGLIFIGTFEQSLGLGDFEFGDSTEEINGKTYTKSGFVHEGNENFVKCATLSEAARAIEIVKSALL